MTTKKDTYSKEFQHEKHRLNSIIIQIEQLELIPKSKRDTLVRMLSKYKEDKDEHKPEINSN